MSHKAFAFDWNSFARELLPLLEHALSKNDEGTLWTFIEANAQHCRNPYEDEPIERDWPARLETGDIQELADFALTKYYNPSNDCGLHELWMPLASELPDKARIALLGFTIGPETHPFDPGRMGSYFQTPEIVRDSLEILSKQATLSLPKYLSFLKETVKLNRGLFITF